MPPVYPPIDSGDIQRYYDELEAIGYFADDGPISLRRMFDYNLAAANRSSYDQYFKISTQNDYSIEYIFIPKNGTHYIINKFKIDSETSIYSAITDEQSFLNNNYKMTVIRDPIDRVISSYQEMLKLREDCNWSTPITKKMMFYKTREDIEKSFAYFLQEVHKYGFYDQHIFPQHLCIDNDLICYKKFKNNFIFILFENMQNELEEFAEIHKIDYVSDEEAKSKFVNKGSTEIKERITKFLKDNNNFLKLVKHLYSEDFKLHEKVKNEDRFYS